MNVQVKKVYRNSYLKPVVLVERQRSTSPSVTKE